MGTGRDNTTSESWTRLEKAFNSRETTRTSLCEQQNQTYTNTRQEMSSFLRQQPQLWHPELLEPPTSWSRQLKKPWTHSFQRKREGDNCNHHTHSTPTVFCSFPDIWQSFSGKGLCTASQFLQTIPAVAIADQSKRFFVHEFGTGFSQPQSSKHALKINVKTHNAIQQYQNKQRIEPSQISHKYGAPSHGSDSQSCAVQRGRDGKHIHLWEA